MNWKLATCLLVLTIAAPVWAQTSESRQLVATPELPTLTTAKVLDGMLYDYRTLHLPLSQIDQQVRQHGRLRLHLSNRQVELQLELNDLRAEDYRLVVARKGGFEELDPPAVSTYRGHVVGAPTSTVRLTIRPDHFSGYIFTTDSRLFIDPVSLYDRQAASSLVVVYRDEDARSSVDVRCGTQRIHQQARDLAGLPTDPVSLPPNKAQTSTLRLATDADGEFVELYSSSVFAAAAAIRSIVNQVDGIYERDMGINVQLVFQLLWYNKNIDPYPTTTNSSTRLGDVRNYWNNSLGWVNRHTVHLFSGVQFGQASGLSDQVSVCGGTNYSLHTAKTTQGGLFSSRNRKRLVAHEIAHNLGARHISDHDCQVGQGPIMCSNTINQPQGCDGFEGVSIDSMNATCLNIQNCDDSGLLGQCFCEGV